MENKTWCKICNKRKFKKTKCSKKILTVYQVLKSRRFTNKKNKTFKCHWLRWMNQPILNNRPKEKLFFQQNHQHVSKWLNLFQVSNVQWPKPPKDRFINNCDLANNKKIEWQQLLQIMFLDKNLVSIVLKGWHYLHIWVAVPNLKPNFQDSLALNK